VARKRAAKHCIWQLELNTNNDEEILNEAANVRNSMFLRWVGSKWLFSFGHFDQVHHCFICRSLATQFF
jgi:hypothetical protein